MSFARFATSVALAALCSGTALAGTQLPRPFRQQLLFMAQNADVPALAAAVPALLDGGFFDRLVVEWTDHRKSVAASKCSEQWCRGLDVFLTHYVDPDEQTMWTVDVYRILGPVEVRVPDVGFLSAHLVKAGRWRGENYRPTRFAVVVKDGQPVQAYIRFATVGTIPPEFDDNPAVAFQKRMLAARQAFPSLGAEIEAASVFWGAQPMGFLFAVGEAWDRFQQGTPDDPATRIREKLPTSVYWWMDDFVRRMHGETVEVLSLEGPMPLRVKGEIRPGWVTKVRIAPKEGGKAEERRFAVFSKEGLIESLSPEFEPVSR